MLNMSDNHENTQKDAILLLEVGQIQTINQRKPLFKGIIQTKSNLKFF